MTTTNNDLVYLSVDGATGPSNPGPITTGGLILDRNGDMIESFTNRKPLASTNNVAEYMALIDGLELCWNQGFKNVVIFMDSDLVVNQVKGEWQCTKPHLKPLLDKVLTILKMNFDKASTIHWHSRDTPIAQAADLLSKGTTPDAKHYEVNISLQSHAKKMEALRQKTKKKLEQKLV